MCVCLFHRWGNDTDIEHVLKLSTSDNYYFCVNVIVLVLGVS